MARHELISVNFFDSLCSKRFRTFFFLCSETKRKRLQGRLNFGRISCFSKSDRVMRINKLHAAKLCEENFVFQDEQFFCLVMDQQIVSVWVTSSPSADLFTYPGYHTLR